MRFATLVLPLLLLPLLAGCLGSGERTEWAYDDSGLDELRATGRTGNGVTIAILDTGINTGHVALRHLVDGDPADGELMAFRDFLGNAAGPNEAFDDDGHGTHVTAILAARGTDNNQLLGGIELRGAAPDALYVVGRICATTCDASLLPEAIGWAVQQGADVISLSLGGQFNLTDLSNAWAIQQAIDAAIDSGVVVVSSAGNQGPGNDDVESPANIPGVIAVGAIDLNGAVASFSSRGSASANQCILDVDDGPIPLPPGLPSLPQLPIIPQVPNLTGRCFPDQKPELVAPGVDIVSAWTDDSYVRASGTSQAAPFVTAAVALILEGRPNLVDRSDVEQLKRALVEAAQPVDGQALPHDVAAGYGRLDALAALRLYEQG